MIGDSGLVFSVLGSGSGGNCVVVQGGGAAVLVDAGLTLKDTTGRLRLLGLEAAKVDAILVTHEHGDHVNHVSTLARRLGAPILANARTLHGSRRFLKGGEAVEGFSTGTPFRVGRLEITPLGKPHDAAEPVSFLIASGDEVLGVFTDIGHVDDAVGEAMARCTAMVLESNHDPAMLAAGPYPATIKARVGGRLGHLSNDDSALALRRWMSERLRAVVLAHVSTTNNTPALVRGASLRHLGPGPGFRRWLSRQDRPTPILRGSGLSVEPAASAGE